MVKSYRTALLSLSVLCALSILSLAGCAAARRDGLRCGGAPRLALRGATVFAGEGLAAIPEATIVVEKGRIAAVLRAGERPPRDGCSTEVDISGAYVLPGLWDVHFHVSKVGSRVLADLPSLGITGVRDMGSSMSEIQELRRRSVAGLDRLPHLSSPGPMYEAATPGKGSGDQRTLEPKSETRRPIPKNAEELTAELVELRRSGADFVKLRAAADKEEFLRFVGVASRLGLPVATHPPPGLTPSDLRGRGLVSIEHASYPYPIVGGDTAVEQIAGDFVEGGITVVPTIVAWRTQVMDIGDLAARTEAAVTDPRRVRFIPPRLAVEWRFDLAARKPRSAESSLAWKRFYEQLIVDLRALHGAGVPLVGGSDAGVEGVVPGLSLREELCALEHEVGIAPMDVLRGNTVVAARLAGVAAVTGSISPGKSADFIVLGQDPRKGIGALGSLQRTYLRGIAIDPFPAPGCR